MPSDTATRQVMTSRRWALVAVLLSAGLSVAYAQSTSDTPPAEPSSATPAEPASTAEPNPPREAEAPIDASGDLSTLEYEPSESISEDKSVAFPVDI